MKSLVVIVFSLLTSLQFISHSGQKHIGVHGFASLQHGHNKHSFHRSRNNCQSVRHEVVLLQRATEQQQEETRTSNVDTQSFKRCADENFETTTAAAAATHNSNKKEEESIATTTTTATRKKNGVLRRSTELASKGKIFSTIDALIQARKSVQCTSTSTSTDTGAKTTLKAKTDIGILGDAAVATPNILNQSVDDTNYNIDQTELYSGDSQSYITNFQPKAGTILVAQKSPLVKSTLISKSNLHNHISVQVASETNDAEIANLRLSVFNDYTIDSNDEIKEWVGLSCDVIDRRRRRGSTCICASVQYLDEGKSKHSWIIGGIECSMHEFLGTELGLRRPLDAVLYITEVAVSPRTRRCGAGKLLLDGVDEFAAQRNIETLYLHVDVSNTAAIKLYKQAGYAILDPADDIYLQFTTSLNLHDGANKGRKHYLMHKKLTRNQTWHELFSTESISPSRGILGIDIFSTS